MIPPVPRKGSYVGKDPLDLFPRAIYSDFFCEAMLSGIEREYQSIVLFLRCLWEVYEDGESFVLC